MDSSERLGHHSIETGVSPPVKQLVKHILLFVPECGRNGQEYGKMGSCSPQWY